MEIRIQRIYDPPTESGGRRVLVDRLWPRGVSKERAALDQWLKEVAPSNELRKAYHAGELDWEAFAERYRHELDDQEELLAELLSLAEDQPLTLLYSVKDPDHNHARILADRLEELQ